MLGDRAQVLGVQVGVHSGACRPLGLVEDVIHLLAGDVEHDAAEHAHKASVGIPGETLVVRLARQAVDGLVVQAEVEDRVHHARHGLACA